MINISTKLTDKFIELISNNSHILIIQADNPDADSLGSALSLESIFSKLNKQVSLYCRVDIPDYLKYMQGWSRVSQNLSSDYDISIIVDASAKALFENSDSKSVLENLSSKPCIVIDHHVQTANDIDFASLVINEHKVSSTCELIFHLATINQLSIPSDGIAYIANGILGDTQGLSNNLATAETYRVMSQLIDQGLNRPKLEDERRLLAKMPMSIYKFKASLIDRTQFLLDNRLAFISINHKEIRQYSPLYNPGPLIQPDLLQVEGVIVGIVLKIYDNGTITGMIRSNSEAPIADKIAANFGGGGHSYAAGFKITHGHTEKSLKAESTKLINELLTR
jgi:bifunctional oligoribonuclease and PAP phosphatase NrnA